MREWLHPPMLLASVATPVGGGGDPPATIDGTWARGETAAGSRTTITLSSRSGVVSGAGTYVGPGGMGGTLSVAGTWQAGRVDLTLRYSDGAVGRFMGTATGTDQLAGTLALDGGLGCEASFSRQ